MMSTNTAEWIRTGELIGSDKPVATKTFADGTTAAFYLDTADREAVAVIILNIDGAYYSTENSSDWDAFDTYVPRYEWPEVIYAGKRTGAYAPHTAVDPVIAKLVAEAQAYAIADEDED